jgi:hypothetical protein
MDEETKQQLREMSEKIDKIYKSTEQTRKYFTWTMIISLVVIVLPLIALLFVLPLFFSSPGGIGGGGGNINQTLDTLGL